MRGGVADSRRSGPTASARSAQRRGGRWRCESSSRAVRVLLLAAAVSTARGLDPRDRGLLPTGTTGVVILDLSLSILDDQSGVVRRTLQTLVETD